MSSIWVPRCEEKAPESMKDLARKLNISTTMSGLLFRRGYRSLDEMDRYLSPGLKHLPQPADIPGLTDAATILARELSAGKTLAVWGDYDVDGVTSTAVVLDFLASRGLEAMHHLPDRRAEGYGMNPAGVERLHESGARVLLSVDCGVSDFEAVERARELGMTVVVTDHHLPGDELPRAHAVCNPRLDPECPLGHMAGVGVAFMLMAALNRMLPGQPSDVRSLLDLVALGTIADVVSLTGVNRVLVKNGLLLLKEARRPGIAALKEVSGFARDAELGAGQVGFSLAPRINAAGRLGSPEKALNLLMSPDKAGAEPIARELDAINTERRREEEDILGAALDQAAEQMPRMGLVLHGRDWHPGVIGIVASRVVERYNRPTLVLCSEGDSIKGSGRSMNDFHLYEGLRSFSHLLTRFGGHKLAAGLSFEADKLEQVRSAFDEAVSDKATEEDMIPILKYDGALPFERIDATLVKEIQLMQPFGLGNPEPVFIRTGLEVRGQSVFARKHVKMEVSDPDSRITLKAKGWRMADALPRDLAATGVDLAYTAKLDTFRGLQSIELSIKDWKRPV